jgi:PTS system cellobiose-specific IIC component
MNKFTEQLTKVAGLISTNKYLTSIRDGFMLSFPITMFASIMIIIQNLPSTFGFEKFMPEAVMNFLNDFFGPVAGATIGVTSLFVVFGVAYHLAGHYKQSSLYAGAMAVANFMILMPFQDIKDAGTFIPAAKMGAQGMFVGIAVALVTAEIFSRIEKADITIKMPESVPPSIAKSFTAIIPGAATILLFNIIRYAFTLTQWGNAFDCVMEVLQTPLMHLGSSLPATVFAVFMTQFLWFFGVHGQAVVNSIMDPIWQSLALENIEAAKNGAEQLPHIVNTTFMGIFPLAGCTYTIGAVIVIILIGKSKRMKSTGELVLVPSIFNISEPITFGLPIVMNPVILVPWILTPIVAVIISYLSIAAGLVPRPSGITVVWSTPIFLSGWLGTGSWRGAALQLVNLVVTTLIWLPFIKALDNQFYKEETAEVVDLDITDGLHD